MSTTKQQRGAIQRLLNNWSFQLKSKKLANTSFANKIQASDSYAPITLDELMNNLFDLQKNITYVIVADWVSGVISNRLATCDYDWSSLHIECRRLVDSKLSTTDALLTRATFRKAYELVLADLVISMRQTSEQRVNPKSTKEQQS